MRKRCLKSKSNQQRKPHPPPLSPPPPPPRQMLPTPQTSTTSWSKEDFKYSSGIEEMSINDFNVDIEFLQCCTTKRPRMLRSFTAKLKNTTLINSSWPFRPVSSFKVLDPRTSQVLLLNDPSIFRLRFKRVCASIFPYSVIMKKLSGRSRSLLFDKKLWVLLLKLSSIYTGVGEESKTTSIEYQKRNEIAFASWTTLLRLYGTTRIRNGESELKNLALTSVILQSKLLEEADVDLCKLEKKLEWMKREKIEEHERKICGILRWKLLTPSPQVILFSSLDLLSSTTAPLLPSSVKLLVSQVLDRLIEDYFFQDILLSSDLNIHDTISSIIYIVLNDLFSVFNEPRSESESEKDKDKDKDKNVDVLIKPLGDFKQLSKRFVERVEIAIESVVNCK